MSSTDNIIIIDNFNDEKYKFLSNLYYCLITYKDITYIHAEGAFQAQKTDNEKLKLAISHMAPERAHKAEEELITPISDWDKIKDEEMYNILKEKYNIPSIKTKLLATNDIKIIYGNNEHDNYWGKCNCEKCKALPFKNKLGEIIMQIRDEIKKQ